MGKKEESSEEPEENKADDLRIMSRVNLPKVLVEHHRGTRLARPKSDKFRGWFLKACSYNSIERFLIEIAVVWLIWAILWSFLRDEAMPGSYVFGLAILTSLSYLSVPVVKAFTNLLPGHFMIALGVLARYTFLPELKEMEDYHPETMDYTKRMAFVVFLLRAGQGTNLIHVKHSSTITIRLICIPFMIESVYLLIVTKYALSIGWYWAALIGVMTTPSSPMNIFATSTRLREQGYSPHNKIHSVMIFSSILTTLIALCFVVSLIPRINPQDGWWAAPGAPLILIPGQIIAGSLLGIIVGFIGIYVPSNNNAHSHIYRCLYLITSSFFFIFVVHEKYRGASFLAAYLSPLVATTGWKHLNYYASVVHMRNVTTLLWSWTQPFLFALIGAGIEMEYLKESRRLIFIGVYLSALLVNFGSSVLATTKSNFSWKHRLLIWLSRAPKGTVEMAMSAWISMAAKQHLPNDEKRLDRALLITDCCVLALMISGPIGGFVIDIVGRKVLQKENRPETSKSEYSEDDEKDENVNVLSERSGVRVPQQIL